MNASDPKTLNAYGRGAADFARDWHDQPPPAELHALVRRHFRALAGAALLLDERAVSASSGKTIHRIVAQMLPRRAATLP